MPSPGRRLSLACLAAGGALVAAGCISNPGTEVFEAASTTAAPANADHPAPLVGASLERHIRGFTVRVRTVGCYELSTGSGVAIGPDIFVTNHHVITGAKEIQVATWDGRSLPVQVSAVSESNDLSVVRVDGGLPDVATVEGDLPSPGDAVTAVGYPGGGEFTLSEGHVVDVVDGEPFSQPGKVIRATASVRPGNSGGPLLDGDGNVVGVIFAYEVRTNYALAIPAQTLVAERDHTTPLQLDDCKR